MTRRQKPNGRSLHARELNRVAKAKKRDAQDRVLALLAQGTTVVESCRQVGRTKAAYYQWCKDEPWFRIRAAEVQGREARPGTTERFVEFRKAYFGYDTFPHHAQIIEAIETAKPKSVTMILVPPGAGKTTIVEDYICYLLGPVNPDLRICVIGEKEYEAAKRIRRIANRMVDEVQFESYIRAYGPFKPPDRAVNKPWSAHAISIVRAQNDERDFSLEAHGAGGAIYGARFDLMVLDDVQSVRSLNLTEKLIEYFRQDVYTRFPPDEDQGRIVIVGTRVGPDDFYERLLSAEMVDNLVKIPALDETGRSYWPKVTLASGKTVGFSETDLARIESMVGPEVWSRVYMQEPISKRGQTFSDVVLDRAKDTTRTVKSHVPPGLFTIGALDPALSGHASFRIASFDYERLYLMWARNEEGLGRFEEMWSIIDELSALYRPSVWVIEGNAIQGGIARSDTIEALARKHGFRIETHQSGRNKMDPQIGVASMAGSFIGGKVSIPWADQESQDNAATLVDELRKWRPDVPAKFLRQDEVMSLWFCHLYWQRMRSTLASRIDGRIERGGLPYAPTSYRFAGVGA